MYKKGFTLIELLVVMSIIALLASIIIVAVDDARNKAKIAAIQQGVKAIQTEVELNKTSTGDYFPSNNDGNCDGMVALFDLDVVDNAIAQIADSASIDTSDSAECFMELDPDYWVIGVDIDNIDSGKIICSSFTGAFGIYEDTDAANAAIYCPII